MSKRVVIAAGGTGGHLFPAQSLACTLLGQMNKCDVLFVAKGLSSNARFNPELYSHKDVASGPINLKLKTLLLSPWSILKGIVQSVKVLRQFKADVVIGFGSYHSFPVLCAARLLNIPIVLHEANSVPGKVNRIFSPYAVWTGVFFPDSSKHLKGDIKKTDIPLRKQFSQALRPSRQEALSFYGLKEGVMTVLVFGGSLGAKKLNELAAAGIILASAKTKLQVLHFTGSADATEKVKQCYENAGIVAIVREFEPQMQYAWAAADVCLSRSGASTIAEAVAFTVPSILIPYPFAADKHQDKNAEYVATTIGGAEWYHESKLEASLIAGAIERLVSQPQHAKMKEALHQASINLKASHFSDLVIEFLESKV